MTPTQERAVRDALMTCIKAFEAGDTDAMRDAFARNATSFPRVAADRLIGLPVDLDRYRRVEGIDPEMLAAVRASTQASDTSTLTIEPEDLDILVSVDMALATFHILADGELGRRTFVMTREGDEWKILHVHASNVTSVDDATPA